MRTPILFSPSEVEHVLDHLPSVAARLNKDPDEEGLLSKAFPRLRKTYRELYRWLANTHYEHLADPLSQLEETYAAGCAFGELLRTSDRELFGDHVAEVLVAHDLLRRRYAVQTVRRSDGRTPDLRVQGHGIDVAVEVYSPRELLAVDAWLHDVKDLLNYIDIRASYRWDVSTELKQTIPPNPSQFDPWAPAMMLAQTRDAVVEHIRLDVESALRELRPLSRVYEHAGTPLLTKLKITEVEAGPADRPARSGSFSYPGFSGYSPAGVFKKIVGKSQEKAEQRQTKSVTAEARALVVYLVGTEVDQDLVHPAHMAQAKLALNGIDPRWFELDVIAFVVRAMPEGMAAIFTVADDTTLTIPQVQAMFG